MLSFLASLGIGTIARQIASAYEARERAKTDSERVAAEARIKTLEAKRDVLVAEGGSHVNAYIRALFALPVAVYYAKLFVWDKVLGLGATDPLSPALTDFAMIVVGFYFLADTAATVTRIIKR